MLFYKLVSDKWPYHFVVSPSTAAEETGLWRLTVFRGDEPQSHTVWLTAEEAIASGTGKFVRGQAPVGGPTFTVTEIGEI